MLKGIMIGVVQFIIFYVSIFFLLMYSSLRIILKRKNYKKVIFGTTPILSNKYWSEALKQIGIDSETLMKTYYDSINSKNSYDKYFDDVLPKFITNKYLKNLLSYFFIWKYVIDNTKIFVMPFSGVVFDKFCWRLEYLLFKLNGIKVIVLSYGSDAYMYSKIKDPSLQNALLISYPDAAKNEKKIEDRVFFWSKYADFVMTGFMGIDGMPRWDLPIHQFVQIDTEKWVPKRFYSSNNGLNGVVKIIHTPNHRGFKGTEFLIKAVDNLKDEGLQIELLLLEKVSNDKVRKIMQEADILAEQFIFTGYALSGIEGMASGLPVMANLDNEQYTTLFRRYSFLNECPIVSTTPETLKKNIKMLVTKPEIRKELGQLGRKYVKKYHSYRTAQYLFTSIFRKIEGEDVDLINLFHPLKSEYVKNNYIKIPLINNKLITENND